MCKYISSENAKAMIQELDFFKDSSMENQIYKRISEYSDSREYFKAYAQRILTSNKDEITPLLKSGYGYFWDDKDKWKFIEGTLKQDSLKDKRVELVKNALNENNSYFRRRRLKSFLNEQERDNLEFLLIEEKRAKKAKNNAIVAQEPIQEHQEQVLQGNNVIDNLKAANAPDKEELSLEQVKENEEKLNKVLKENNIDVSGEVKDFKNRSRSVIRQGEVRQRIISVSGSSRRNSV